MTSLESFALVSLTLFSFADLRYRLAPGIEIFFIGAILLTLPTNPFHTGLIVLAYVWGALRHLPGFLSLPLLFYLPTWPVLLVGYGYRQGLVGRADLLAIAGIACLFPLPAVLMSLLGLEIWRRVWVRRHTSPIPVLPGLLVGLLAFMVGRMIPFLD